MKRLGFIEKKIASMIEAVGADRVIHFLVGLWLVTYGMAYGFDAGCLAFVALVVLSLAKDFLIDERHDWGDIIASVVGGMTAFVLMIPVDALDLMGFVWHE